MIKEVFQIKNLEYYLLNEKSNKWYLRSLIFLSVKRIDCKISCHAFNTLSSILQIWIIGVEREVLKEIVLKYY